MRDAKIARKFRRKFVKEISQVNSLIMKTIEIGEPALISRIGVLEAQVLRCVQDSEQPNRSLFAPSIFFSKVTYGKRLNQLKNIAGVYPTTPESIKKFTKEHISGLNESNILGAWGQTYTSIESNFSDVKNITIVNQYATCPWITTDPGEYGYWSVALSGKRVLVVILFMEEFRNQLENI